VCLGTSLKVLKHYSCLWPKKKSAFQLYIVNIQWTPKDKFAKTKINGYCDQILELVVKNLQKHYTKLSISKYAFKSDPIFKLAVKLKEDELNTTTKCILNSKMSQKERGLLKTKSESGLVASNNKLESDEEAKPNEASNGNSWYSRSFKPRKLSNVKTEKNLGSFLFN
jgi:NAD-dependent deacetylase sirtuin 7